MIKTEIIRKFDDLGRIAIPRLVRQELFGTIENEGKPMEIFYEEDGSIILKPVEDNLKNWESEFQEENRR